MPATLTSANEEQIQKHIRLVHYVVNRYRRKALANDVELEDIFQVGCMGLIVSIRKFNPDKGLKFSTYAVPVISGYIKNYITRMTMPVKVSRIDREVLIKIHRLGIKNESLAEISKQIGCTVQVAKRALAQDDISVFSIHQQVSADDETSALEDSIGVTADFTETYVNDFRSSLTPREEYVLDLRSAGYLQREIAENLEVSQVQVSRILKRIGSKYNAYLQGA